MHSVYSPDSFFLSLSISRDTPWSAIDWFIRSNLGHFRVISIGDKFYANLFGAFLYTNVPLSAYIVMALLLGQVHGGFFPRFIALIYFTYQLESIAGIHLAVALLTKRAHAPANVLASLLVRNQHRTGNFRAHSRMGFEQARCWFLTLRYLNVEFTARRCLDAA